MSVAEALRQMAARYQSPPAQARLTAQPREVALWGPPGPDGGAQSAVLLRGDGDIELFSPNGTGLRIDETHQAVVLTGKRLKLLFDEIYFYTASGSVYLNDEPLRPTRPYTLVVPPSGGVFRIPGNADLEVAEPARLRTRLQTAQRAAQALSGLV